MQKIGILNSHIAKILCDMGHTDQICIGDCGLPVPNGVPKIDLALKQGEPSFIDVVRELNKYMQIQKIYVAPETKTKNPKQWESLHEVFPEDKVEWIILSDHDMLKEKTKQVKAVIRTGEITPYSNVILESGVIF